MKIEILYKDSNFLIINKPFGVLVHGDGRGGEETISEWFVSIHPDAKNVGEPITNKDGIEIKRPGVVHRLDKDTSGILVLVKNQEAFLFMKKQFQERKVQKTYHAFVYGEIKEDNGTIDRPIGRSSKDFRLRSAQRGAKGVLREAVTEYVTIKRGKEHSFLELIPKTGRTHQLRAHLKAISHPVVCDALYAPKRDCALGFERLALHASKIEFIGPDKQKIAVEAPLPDEFKVAEKAL